MASPVDDPKSYLTIGQTVWAMIVIVFGLGVGWANLKRDISRSKERHDGHDKKFKELDEKLDGLVTKEYMKEFKTDMIREMYTLFDSGPRPPIDRRREPR